MVDSNMAVIKEGLEATIKVDYDDPAFVESDKHVSALSAIGVAVSASMSRVDPQRAERRLLRPQLLPGGGVRPLQGRHHRRGPGHPGDRHVHADRQRRLARTRACSG
ncbi:MAG: hypothetical protein MZW92_42670 [Comamonadaceae bacterium]|nr:hypothetical protein [Comamonadaceae bacterium]